jgi:hexosaminidase
MHLDVSRHFFPKDFIKKYIDLIALHKMNVFHWHLTDDNGWRIEIDQYPLLTEVSAWRADRANIPWTECSPQRPGEKATYGGFYTKEDIREIVEYARQRFITVIPEIEMPGHTSEVFAAYPQYSCSGERTAVQTGSYWPNTDIFCAGKEETFRFIENVLGEVIELFPSEYIHIGGDEADKTAWKSCPACQSRIRKEGLAGEDELQSYFVKRIERYLKSKGKKLIGWDEILEGGLPPDATVMSWRGFEGGIEAAGLGHEVVICPTSHCYFDYYQADPDFQPPAIGGLITVKKVYSFRPVPYELQMPQRHLILGGQGNLWTEYISTTPHAEYMALPRMTALAEVLWSPESKLEWDDFNARLQTQFKRFENMGVNYSPGSGKVEAVAVIDPEDNSYAIRLQAEIPGVTIHYTLDGTNPTNNSFTYKNPVKLNHDVTLMAIAYRNEEKLERAVQYKISPSLIVGKNIIYREAYSERYPAAGKDALIDGLRASTNYNDGYWQGFNGRNVDLVIDLGGEMALNSITSTYLLDQKKWIFLPDTVKYYISEDGQNFQQIAALTHKIQQEAENAITNDFTMKLGRPMTVNFLRIRAVNMGYCPAWHPGKGQKAWLFIDEIVLK